MLNNLVCFFRPAEDVRERYPFNVFGTPSLMRLLSIHYPHLLAEFANHLCGFSECWEGIEEQGLHGEKNSGSSHSQPVSFQGMLWLPRCEGVSCGE